MPLRSSPRGTTLFQRPESPSVYIIMSYTAPEQIGRYVFHCHILKHEDTGTDGTDGGVGPVSAVTSIGLLQ